MFKFTHVFLMLGMLVATAQGDDLSCSDFQTSQADVKELVHDLRTRLGQQFGWPAPLPVQNVKPSTPLITKQKKVAFFAGLSKHIGSFTQNTDLVFDNVVTNIGSAYSASTGRFTAPVTAVYQFGITITATHGKKAGAAVLKNGVWTTSVWSVATPEWAPSSRETILWLKAGDQVWLKLYCPVCIVHGEMQTTFSGFLIFEN